MKRFITTLLCLSTIGAIFTGCKDDPENGPVEPPKADLLTFGFLEEDNEGVIIHDYAGVITGTNVAVTMPRDADKTALVAYFTVTEGSTVTVDGVAQTSGVTANNFSAAVDYIVSNGTTNNKYTVTIANEADFVWSELAKFTTYTPSTFLMKVNPVTGEPYMVMRALVKENEEDAGVYRSVVAKYSNGAWAFVGPETGFSDGVIAAYVDMTFDSNGNPYVVYPDNSITDNVGAATVKYFDGSAWKTVGALGATSTKVTYCGIALMKNGNPMIVTTYDKISGSIARRDPVVSTYSGTAWTTDVTIPGRASGTGYCPTGKLVNGTTYWAIQNQSSASVSVYAYNNGWTTIADNLKDETATGVHSRSVVRMDVDSRENIYIGVCDDTDEAGIYKYRVKKYTKSTGQWGLLGVIDVSFTGNQNFDMAVSPLRTPFVIYKDLASVANVMYIDSTTKTWSTPYVLSGEATTSDVFIDFDPNTGIGYALYKLDSDDSLVLCKYDRPAN